MKTAMGNAEEIVSSASRFGTTRLTVSKDELRYTGEDHRNAAKEVVVATQANQTLWGNSTLETTKNEDGGGVWDQESNQAQKCRIS
jgi:hypothetical protein